MAPSKKVLWNFLQKNYFLDLYKISPYEFKRNKSDASLTKEQEEQVEEDNHVKEKFHVFQHLPGEKTEKKRGPLSFVANTPREKFMKVDQDWTSVWPGPKTFHPASVPLPLRQGRNKKGVPPGKMGNLELMKIPNFLHLSPPAIEKHCKALKQFCTKWPEALNTEEEIEKHFPVEIIYSDYCHSSPSIRNPDARIVSLRIKLKNLNLDEHATDKFLRLVGERYNPQTDYVTITADNCPIKKQNYNYIHYLLTALYFESWKFEEWEKEKSDLDMETYSFPHRQSFRNLKEIFDYNNKELADVTSFGKAVEDWQNKGDSEEIIKQYKDEVMKVLSLPALGK